jgi:hypothetical protein
VSREETIFAEALAKASVPERTAYLDAACADDAELRRQILRKEMEQLTAQAAR